MTGPRGTPATKHKTRLSQRSGDVNIRRNRLTEQRHQRPTTRGSWAKSRSSDIPHAKLPAELPHSAAPPNS
jgi:hypothetical protein